MNTDSTQSRRLATRSDVIAEITTAIEAGGAASAAEYDLDAIADEAYRYDPCDGHAQDAGFVPLYDGADGVDAFWAIVERHALT